MIFLQEILLLRIEKSFYISHWKSVALFRMSALWLIVRVRAYDASFEIEDARQVPTPSLLSGSFLKVAQIIRKGRNESKMAFQVFTSTNKAFVADTEIIPFFHLSGMFYD